MTIHESSLPTIVQITNEISFHERQIEQIETLDIHHIVVLSPASGDNPPITQGLHDTMERSRAYINQVFKRAYIADQQAAIEALRERLTQLGVVRNQPLALTYLPARRNVTKTAPRKQRRAA